MLFRFLLLLLVFSALSTAEAAPRARQSRFDVDRGESVWTLQYTFSDETNRPRKLSVALPATAVQKDNDVRLTFPRAAAIKAQVAAVRRYAASHKGPDIDAKATKDGVQVRVRGKRAGRMQKALDEAKAAAETALDVFLVRHR
jgi:hypothetical protein